MSNTEYHPTRTQTWNDRRCTYFHTWNNERPTVDPRRLEIQHPELIGLPCDCGRVTYDEEPCGCSREEWRVVERLPQ